MKALELLFQPVGLAAPIACLAGLLPREAAPFALTKPGGNAPHDQPGGKTAKHEEEERRLKGKMRLGTSERIENKLDGPAIDHGKRDQHYAKRHDQKGEDDRAPHSRLFPYPI